MECDSLCELFNKSVKLSPNNIALIWHADDSNNITSRTITYKELSADSTVIEDCLKNQRVEADFVGLLLEDAFAFPALTIGLLRSKLAFSCLNTHGNHILNERLIRSLCIKLIFTDNPNAAEFLRDRGTKKEELLLHECPIQLWHIHEVYHTKPVKSGFAYAIQTSGSTGVPKTIKVPHKCIIPNIEHLRSILDVTSKDIVFLGTSLTFDPSIVELFLAFSSGAALLITPSFVKLAPKLLAETLFPVVSQLHTGVTILQSTPTLVLRWSRSELQNTVMSAGSSLRALILGGEPCPLGSDIAQWKSFGNTTKIYNIYGITEVSCWASIEEVRFKEKFNSDTSDRKPSASADDDLFISARNGSEVVPLGDALSNTLLEVRDELGAVVTSGKGEMFIGGTERVCIINEEDETALHPPVFRATGDIVEVDSTTGKVYYIGRNNRLVKRMGQRVSLAEVERAAVEESTVRQACCVWNESSNRLGLFFTAWTSHMNVQQLRKHLLQRLQPYQVPNVIIPLEKVPTTSHGKIDYCSLSSMLLKYQQQNSISYQSLKDTFCSLWCEYFGSISNPCDKTFKDVGGNSFVAVNFLTQLEKQSNQTLPSTFLFMLLGTFTYKDCCDFLVNISSENGVGHDILTTFTELSGSSVSVQNASDVHEETTASKKKVKRNSTLTVLMTEKRLKTCTCVHSCFECSECKVHVDGTRETKVHNIDKRVQSDEDTTINVSANLSDTIYTSEESRSDTNIVDPTDVNVEDKLVLTCCRGRMCYYTDPLSKIVDLLGSKLGKCSISMRVNWTMNLKKCVDASPLFAQFLSGRTMMVVGSHSHRIVVLDGQTGSQISARDLPDRIESSACLTPCGQRFVVGCYDGGIYCIELKTANIIWYVQTDGMVKSTPTLCMNRSCVTVGSYDHKLYCLSVLDGSIVWATNPGHSSIFSSPCVSPKSELIFVGTMNGTCAALTETSGTILWTTVLAGPVFSSPAFLHDEEYVLFADVLGTVHCLSARCGEELWIFHVAGNIFSSITVQSFTEQDRAGELILFGCHDRHLYCLEVEYRSPSHRVMRWKSELDAPLFATPFVFILGDSSNYRVVHEQTTLISNNSVALVAATTTSGTVNVVGLLTGEVYSSYILPGEAFSSPVVAGDQLIVGCRDNNVYSLNLLIQSASGEAFVKMS